MILILLCVLSAIIGQLLLKKGMATVGTFQPKEALSFVFLAFSSPWIISALVLYVLSLGLWLIVLSRGRLGFAYLFFVLTYIFIPLASWRFLGEELTLSQILGMILIAAGVIIVGAGR